jgi:hypothetical protein
MIPLLGSADKDAVTPKVERAPASSHENMQEEFKKVMVGFH